MKGPRLLLVRNGGLGDTVLLWPALCAVRRRFPAAHLELLGRGERCKLLEVPGGADRAHDAEGSGLHLLYEQQPQANGRLAQLFAGSDTVLLFSHPAQHQLRENILRAGAARVHLFSPFPPEGSRQRVADYLVECVCRAGLGEKDDWRPLPLQPHEKRAGDVCWPAEARGRSVGLLVPGSGSVSKNWPAENWAALAERLDEEGLSVFALRGPADEEAVAKLLDLFPRLPLLECPDPLALKGALARCALVVGNDSGPVQLAALLGVPTLAVFGPTDPARWAPCGPRAEWVGPQLCECAPCTDEQRRRCRHRECLEEISPELVWRRARRLLLAAKGDRKVGKSC